MSKVCFCYNCNKRVTASEDLRCTQCGSDFIELQESNIQDNIQSFISTNLPNIQSIFQSVQRNIPNMSNLFQPSNTATNIMNCFSSFLNSSNRTQSTFNLLRQIFPQLNRIASLVNDPNISRVFQHLLSLHDMFGQHPPAEQHVIDSLQPQRYVGGICIDNTCSICLDDFVQDDEVIVLPCHHGFHKNCIETWLRAHNICPTCRQSL